MGRHTGSSASLPRSARRGLPAGHRHADPAARRPAQASVPQLAYDKFVELKWGKGILSYDDVLYLAIEILKQHPYIYRILAARYPYFFVDEFQDTIHLLSWVSLNH